MAYKEIHEDFLKISRGEAPSRVPFFCISQEFDSAYYGVTYKEYLSSADTMVKAQIKALEEFDYDWVLYQLHDCLASSKLISLDMYKKFVFESNKRLVAELEGRGLKIIYEPADDKVDYMDTYSQTGIHAMNIGIALDMFIAKEKLQGKMGLLGNLDSIKYLQNSSPEKVYKETERIMKSGKPKGGYAFCTDSIPREAVYENMKAMAKAVSDNCKY